MAIIKRGQKETSADLIKAIAALNELLHGQDENEAIEFLNEASKKLSQAKSGSKDQKEAVDMVIDAFHGDHELIAYTHQRDTEEWTIAEQLSMASSRVLSLAKRIK